MIIFATIGVLIGLAYFRASLRQWSFAIVISVCAISYALDAPVIVLSSLVGIAVILCLILSFQPLRLNLLTRPLFGLFKRMLPPLSDTEREALEAGTVGWDGEIFSGDPDWQKLPCNWLPVRDLAKL